MTRSVSEMALHGSCALVGLALTIVVRAAFTDGFRAPSFVTRLKENYGRDFAFLRLPFSSGIVLIVQLALLSLSLLLLTRDLVWGLGLLLVAMSPLLVFRQLRKRRVESIERQIEGWLGSLARALEAAPSLGEALEVSGTMSDAPISEELELVLSEMHLGRPLDRALSAWGARVGSRTLIMALATLQVGRATGGGLPEVLRSAGAALAELERLEGVIRTKTAEGKVQAWMVSFMPVPVYFGVKLSDPHYFVPLEQSAWGHVLLAIAVTFWIVAIFSARKILAVRV